MQTRLYRSSRMLAGVGGIALLLILLLIAIVSGPIGIPVPDVLAILMKWAGIESGIPYAQRHYLVLTGIRLPRALLSALVGAAFGVSGALLQGMFRNPLASPTLIGTSSGAMAGAAGFIVFAGVLGLPEFLRDSGLPLAAFGGACLATLLVYRLATRSGRTYVGTLLLAGIAVNALVLSIVGFLMTLADDAQLRSITFWNLGGLGGNGWQSVWISAVCILPVILWSMRLALPLNALLLGEREARHLGVPVRRITTLCVLLPALAVGASVSVSGNIQFVGLVIPNLVRLLGGPDHRLVIPASALAGGMLMVAADTLARIVVAPAELPVGILTAAIGAPFFLYLLIRDWRREAF